jgi:hypothetical protein
LSAKIAAEIEGITWNESDLLGDIPENDADDAASRSEDGNGCPEGYLPHRIVDIARLASIPLCETGIDRRERLVAAERNRQGRAGTHRLRG